jgi:hypoxia up-regulated 1
MFRRPSTVLIPASQPILSVEVMDIAAALANFTSPSPVVNLTMRLDHRGHLATSNAVLISNTTTEEAKEGGVAGALKGLFGKKPEEEVEDDGEGKDGKDKVKEVKETKGLKVALKFRERTLGVKPMTGEERRVAKAR